MAKKAATTQYYEAVGRRKSAVARVRLYVVDKSGPISVGGASIKKGEIFINKKSVKEDSLLEPLRLTENENRFAISVLVRGGGKNGQLDAIIHGLSRAIEKVDKDKYRDTLKKAGMLKRDSRTRERRKVGRGGKARRQKQSPKR